MEVIPNERPVIEGLAPDDAASRHHSLIINETVVLSADEPSERRLSLPPLLILVILMILATIVRAIATHNDLWLDELISLRIAHLVKTPWQIFTAVHSDNNHYLNTLYLYLVRDYAPAYRWLSVVSGVALVPAGYWLLARRSQAEAAILAGLLACSYPLIHFSSEARGYSGALLGSMLACAALTRWMAPGNGKGRSFLLGMLYATAVALAILSHLTACLIWFAMAVGSFIVIAGRPVACRPERWKQIALWIALNALPTAVLAVLYFVDLRFLTELGGTPMTLPHALGRLFALAVGWPGKGAVTVCIILAPLIVLILRQLVTEEKSGEPLAILLGWMYLTPLICMLGLRTLFFSSRYFLVLVPFFYVPVAILLARLLRMGRGRIAFVALCSLFVAAQGHLYVNFLQVGRGQFTASLRYMMQHSDSARITVASSKDFRSVVELAYFWPRVTTNRPLRYMSHDDAASSQPEWYILHQEGYESPGPPEFHTAAHATWQRTAYFGASELSGQAWTIYRRVHSQSY